jgi:hypothetical protein
MPQEKIYYLNPNIKKSNVVEQFTEEQVQEYIRCSKDPIYFIEKYVKIISIDHGLITIKLAEFQKGLIDKYMSNRFNIITASRQAYKTTTTVVFMLWYSIFHDNKFIAILANKAETAREILDRIYTALEHVPFFLQPGVKELNKGSVEFGNGTKIMASATSKSSIRGRSVALLYIDEYAFVDNAEEFFRSTFPTISSGAESRVIISSTPLGLNHFYKLWKDSNEGRNKFVPTQIEWYDVPGRDEKWKQEQLEILGEHDFRQEYGNEFLGSANTLIAGWKLKEMTHETPIRSDLHYTIIEDPKPDNSYIAVVDGSRGINNDYSTITVVNITEYPFRVVATYRNNEISTLLFPRLIVDFCKKYNDAYLLIERNNMGDAIAKECYYEEGYENVICAKSGGRRGQITSLSPKKDTLPGVEMTKSVKRIGCSILKNLVEDDKLISFTEDIILELYNFVGKADTFQADEDKHDDLVMNLVLFCWFADQPLFKEIADISIRGKIREPDPETKIHIYQSLSDEDEAVNLYNDELAETFRLLGITSPS